MEIDNIELVTSIFGEWPSFHDAGLLSLLVEKTDLNSTKLIGQFTISETTPETDANGYFVTKNKSQIVLGFEGVEIITINLACFPNILEELYIKKSKGDLHVTFPLIMEGGSIEFNCKKIQVIQAKLLSD